MMNPAQREAARRRSAELALEKRLIAAADLSDGVAFKAWLKRVGQRVEILKLGPELFTARDVGFQDAAKLLATWYDQVQVMYDGKFHEIPSKMQAAVANLGKYQNAEGGKLVWGFTIHGANGAEALREVAKAKGAMKMLVVSVLTTMTEEQCLRIYGKHIKDKVLEFAHEAAEGGADGLVCSPAELAVLAKHSEFDHLERVTPNIRPSWAVVPGDDQNKSREMTPKNAILAGATRLVVGRPVSGAFLGYEEAGVAGNVTRLLEEIRAGMDELDATT